MAIGQTAKLPDGLSVDVVDGYDVPVWKRALDITCIVVALPVLVPVFLLMAAGIKCVSPGPVLFLSERVGYRGRRFICFKFRTMKVNADSDAHRRHLADLMRSDAPMVKMDANGDPRLIPLGRVLRATGLDELPQLLNVLRGEMSLVGPRMITLEEVQKYGKWGLNLHTVKPGITGLWQVTGRSELTYEERVRLDMNYIRNYSIWLDLQILFQTIPAVVMSKGAY